MNLAPKLPQLLKLAGGQRKVASRESSGDNKSSGFQSRRWRLQAGIRGNSFARNSRGGGSGKQERAGCADGGQARMPGPEDEGVGGGRGLDTLEGEEAEAQKVPVEEDSKTTMGEHQHGGVGGEVEAGATDRGQPGTGSGSGADTKGTIDASSSMPVGEVGGGVGGGGVVGGGLFAHAREFGSRTNKAAVGLVVDIDPRHPAVLGAVAVVAILLSVWWGCNKANRKRAGRRARAVGGGVNALETTSPVGDAGYNTRRGRTARNASPSPSPAGAAKPRTPAKVLIMTPEQASLCEVLYDVYGGVVPSHGINSRAVRDCELKTADIRRQFRSIKQAREANALKGKLNSPDGATSPLGAFARSPASPLRGRSSLVSPKAGRGSAARGRGGRGSAQSPSRMLASRLPAKRSSSAKPKKAPASPKKSPVKRGPSTRPTPSPNSGSVDAKRTTGRAKGAAAVEKVAKPVPTTPESPMATRGKSSRVPSSPVSPKSTPRKRAASAAAVAGGGGRGRKGVPSPKTTRASSPKNTPSKRGASSLLEIARREAQLKAGAVASARASSLTSKSEVTASVTRSKRAKA